MTYLEFIQRMIADGVMPTDRIVQIDVMDSDDPNDLTIMREPDPENPDGFTVIVSA